MEWTRYETIEERDFTERAMSPFTWEERGKKYRLAWPLGSTEIAGFSSPAVWDDTFAVVVRDEALTVASIHSDRVARLSLPAGFMPSWFDVRVRGRLLYLKSQRHTYSMPLAELESLLEGKNRDEQITLRTEYPDRDPNARVECVYLWKLQDGNTMLEIGDGKGGNNRPKLTVHFGLVLPKHTPVTVCDQLRSGEYARAEVAGHPPQTLIVMRAPQTFTATLKLSRAGHPEGKDRPVVAKADAGARERIETLIAAIAREPEDDGHRAVLIDLLAEIEDPAAATFAAMRNGKPVSAAKKKAALGPLASYIVDYEVRAGLPITATLSRSAKAWSQVLDEASSDYRLGLLTALRIGLGNHAVNAAFVASPRATALRDIDLTHTSTFDAVIEAKRAQFTRIGGLDVMKKRMIAKLADPVFDTVATFHAVVEVGSEVVVEAIISNPKQVYSRVRRTLELEIEHGADLVRTIIRKRRDELPVAKIVINGVSVD